MPENYTKEDVDQAYRAGVISAEKLWQSFLLNMLDEGAVQIQCLECQKCGERYRLDPDVTYPRVILCPSCNRYRSDVVGICQKVTRRVAVTQYQLNTMQAVMDKMIDPLVTLRTVFQTSDAAKGLTMEQATQLPQYRELMDALTETEALRASGWDPHRLVKALSASDATSGIVPLERYDSAKPVTCAQ